MCQDPLTFKTKASRYDVISARAEPLIFLFEQFAKLKKEKVLAFLPLMTLDCDMPGEDPLHCCAFVRKSTVSLPWLSLWEMPWGVLKFVSMG